MIRLVATLRTLAGTVAFWHVDAVDQADRRRRSRVSWAIAISIIVAVCFVIGLEARE